MHVSLDSFVDMFYWEAIEDPEQRKACHAFGVTAFHRSLPVIIGGGYPVIVDHVFERRSWYDECLAAAQEAGILLVGVRCPLEVVEQREQTRENRRNGLARSQFNVAHESKPYDLEVDTSVLSPEARAKAQRALSNEMIENDPLPFAADHVKSRFNGAFCQSLSCHLLGWPSDRRAAPESWH
jgi:chloramphenicol 3-O phosphotransferase